MNFRKTLIILGVIIAVSAPIIAFVLLSAAPSNTGSVVVTGGVTATSLGIGSGAPDFSLEAINGNKISLSTIKEEGKPTILYFFATWCPYCREDFKNANPVYQKYSDKISFVAVDMDLAEDRATIINYRDSNGYHFDFAQGNQDILLKYGVTTTTTTYVLNGDGKILFRKSGTMTSENWDKLFAELI